MFKRVAIVAALVAGSLPALVSAQEEQGYLRLAPATNWNLDYAEDSCALRRIFGEEGRQVFLSMRQFAPGDNLTISVSSEDFRRLAHMRRFAFGFVPDAELISSDSPMSINVEGFGEGALFTSALHRTEDRAAFRAAYEDGADPPGFTDNHMAEREAEIRGLALQNLFREDILLETGSMHPAMTAMRACMDELLTHWGIDVEAHRSLTRGVQPLDQDRWVRPIIRSYPASALRNGEQGYVRVRLSVSTEGRATDCAVQSQFNDSVLDETACRELLQHSRFEPALDANGEPIASFWTTTVIYAIN